MGQDPQESNSKKFGGLKFPKPNDKWGYTLPYLKEILEEDTYQEFIEWLTGQTVAVSKDGEHVALEYDVHRFFKIIPGKDVWD